MKLMADTHTHTLASTHAYSTLLENARQAAELGLECLGMTDHAPAMPDTPHLWHFHNLHVLPKTLYGVRILQGAECNILDETGRLDLGDEDLKRLEWRVASIHAPAYGSVHTEAENTGAFLGVCANPYIDVIGHCGRGDFPFDYERLIPLFKESGKLVEINESTLQHGAGSGNWKRCTHIARLCKRYEVPVVVNSDAHFALSVGHCPHALKMLEEISFPEKLVVNADSERFWTYLAGKGIER